MPGAGTFAQTCPNCPDQPRELMFRHPSGRCVVRCARCGLQFLDAYPDLRAEEHRIYPEEYYRKAFVDLDTRANLFGALLDEVEQKLGRRGRLLEIGAGNGALLELARRRGWRAEGTEVSTAIIPHLRETLGLTVHLGELEQLGLPPASYDMIILYHVLEHVRDPKSTLRECGKLLGADGLVRIEVPNLASFSNRAKNFQSRFKLKRRPWKHYGVGHHFWFFTPRTLRETIGSAGLHVVACRAPARQWPPQNPFTVLLNRLYRSVLWGGNIVVYAGRPGRGQAAARTA